MQRMSRLLPLAALVLLTGCGDAPATPGSSAQGASPAPEPPLSPPPPEVPVSPIALDWSATLAPEQDALHVRYRVENGSPSRIYLLDRLLTVAQDNFHLLPDAFIVQNGASPGLVLLQRRFVIPDNKVMLQVVPAVSLVEPGQVHEGSGTVPLPLQSWHPFGKLRDLDGAPRELRLELGYLATEPEWNTPPIAEDPSARVPASASVGQHEQVLRGEALPMPR